MSEELPQDIVRILKYLADAAAGYGNNLKWNEEAKLKADLMSNRRYWIGFPALAVRDKCTQFGMTHADAALVADLVQRAQAGRRLVAHRDYRDHKFSHERPGTGTQEPLRTSRDW
mgnify:CR=1 FL=1